MKKEAKTNKSHDRPKDTVRSTFESSEISFQVKPFEWFSEHINFKLGNQLIAPANNTVVMLGKRKPQRVADWRIPGTPRA